jgi:hypothetical protein
MIKKYKVLSPLYEFFIIKFNCGILQIVSNRTNGYLVQRLAIELFHSSGVNHSKNTTLHRFKSRVSNKQFREAIEKLEDKNFIVEEI